MLRLVKLEDRLVLDGAAFAEALEAGIAEISAETLEVASDIGDKLAVIAPAAANGANAQGLDVVLVSNALDDADQLLAAVGADAKVVVYDAEQDSAADILGTLAQAAAQNGLSLGSLTLVAHADEAAFRLGNDVIDANYLNANADVWAQLQSVMAEDARIDLFGCNLAGDEAGKQLVDQLATLTSTQVSASDDLTGAGGDWELEYRSGELQASNSVLDTTALAEQYSHSLEAPVVTTNTGAIVSEGSSIVLTTDMLDTTDPDTPPEDIVYRLESELAVGFLRNGNETMNLGDTFTQADLEAGLIQYSHDGTESRFDSFDFSVTDEGLGATSGTFDFNIQAVNDRPQIDLDADLPGRGSLSVFTEGEGAVNVTNPDGVSLFDSDSANIQSASIHLANIQDPGQEFLTVDVTGTNISFEYNATTGMMTLFGTDTQTAYEQVLQTLQYENLSNDPETNNRIVNITVNDGDRDSAVARAIIEVIPVNDAPNISAPGDQVTAEDTALTIEGISVSDPDDRGEDMVVTLSVEHGVITLSQTDNIQLIDNDGVEETSITLQGSEAAINAALVDLGYTPDLNYHGEDTLSISINDLGNTGGGDLTDADTVNITITSVNDPPIIDLNGPDNPGTDMVVQFVEDGGPISAVDGQALIIEADDGTLAGAQVFIENPQEIGDELLAVDVTGTNITVNFDADTGVLTLSGVDTAENYQTVLRTLTYENISQNPTTADRTLRVEVTDEDDATVAAQSTVEVSPVNDAPEWTVPEEQQADEETDQLLSGISLADIDVNDGEMLVTLSVGDGVLSLGDTTGLTFTDGDGSEDVTMTFSGQIDDINAALATLVYRGDLDFNGTDQLQLNVDDQGNTGPDPLQDSATVDIVVNPVNDPAVIDASGPDDAGANFDAVFVEEAGPVNIVDSDLTVIDVDGGNLASAEITLQNPLDGDGESLSVDVGDSGLVASFDPETFVLTLTGEASPETYQEVLRTLQYDNLIDEPDLTDRTVSIVVNDGVEDSAEVLSIIDMLPANDPPEWTVPVNQVVEANTVIALPGITLADDDAAGGDIEATISVSNGTLSIEDVSQLEFVNGDGTDDATMTFRGTLEEINAALEGLSYIGELDFEGTETVVLHADDLGNTGGPALTADAQFLIDVDSTNDAPVITVPGDQSVDEDNPLAIPGISIHDPDVRGGDLEVTVTVAHGTLTLGNLDNITVLTGDGTEDPVIVFRGTEVNVNAALADLVYNPDENFAGDDLLSIAVDDLGNTNGDPLTDAETIDITVNPVNDAPVLDLDGEDGDGQDYRNVFTEGEGPVAAIDADASFDDLDSETLASATLTLTNPLDGTAETLAVDTTGTNITAEFDPDTGVLTLSGEDSRENYEAVLRTATYENLSHLPDLTDRVIEVVVNDGVDDSNTAISTIEIIPVNDAPLWSAPGTQTVIEEIQAPIPNLSIADVDVGDGELEVTLSVTNGVLDFGNTDGLSFSEGDGAGDAQMTFTGTLDDINAALADLRYTGNLDYAGDDQLQLHVNDQGNSDGEPLTDSTTVDIVVQGENDPTIIDLSGPNTPGNGYNGVFTEDLGPVPIVAADMTVSDADVDVLQSATITLTNLPDGAFETLQVVTTGTDITASYDPDTGVLSLTGEDSIENYEAVLRSITYENLSQDPDTSDRLIEIVVDDGNGDSDPAVSTIEVLPINDAPTLDAGGLFQVPVDGTVVIDESRVVVADVDSPLETMVFVLETAPENGDIVVNGNILQAGDSFTYDELKNGEVTYVNTNETAVADEFTIVAQDDQGAQSDSRDISVLIGDGRFTPDNLTHDVFNTGGPDSIRPELREAIDLLTGPDIDTSLRPDPILPGSDLMESAIAGLQQMADDTRYHDEQEPPLRLAEFAQHLRDMGGGPDDIVQAASLLEVLGLDGRFNPSVEAHDHISTAQGHSVGNFHEVGEAKTTDVATAAALGLLNGTVADDGCEAFNADGNDLADAYQRDPAAFNENCEADGEVQTADEQRVAPAQTSDTQTPTKQGEQSRGSLEV